MERKIVKTVSTILLLGACCILVPIRCYAGIVKPGFSYTTLSKKIKKKITGVSYHKNPYVFYKDLRYVKVKYYDFNGNSKSGVLIVNKKIAKKTVKIFYELYCRKYPIQMIRLVDEFDGNDEASMSANNSSAFNYRTIAGKTKLSNHAYGLAIDINPATNPYIVNQKVFPKNAKAYANRNKKTCKGKYRKHMIGKQDAIVKIFKKYGFTWGGDWKHAKDYQHFEYKK